MDRAYLAPCRCRMPSQRHLALQERQLASQEKQHGVLHQVVEVTKDDGHVLDMVLALAVFFVLPGSQAVVLASPWLIRFASDLPVGVG